MATYPQSRPAADVRAAMEEVLAAERSAMDAVAASQRRAEELLQAARVRARRIAERAEARIAALERANASQGAEFGSAVSSPQAPSEPSDEERARLEAALQLLADQLLKGDDAGA